LRCRHAGIQRELHVGEGRAAARSGGRQGEAARLEGNSASTAQPAAAFATVAARRQEEVSMSALPFTVIDVQRAREVTAVVEGDRVRLPAASLEAALGWTLEPRGLCRGSVCIPTAGRPDLATEAGVDLAALAGLLERPLALDAEHRAAAPAASAAERSNRLERLEAPDFALPDLAGRVHRLSEHRGKKVLLIAYASW
jgi:hypothetical protein